MKSTLLCCNILHLRDSPTFERNISIAPSGSNSSAKQETSRSRRQAFRQSLYIGNDVKVSYSIISTYLVLKIKLPLCYLFLLVSCLAYSSTLKMEAICPYGSLDSLRNTWRYSPEVTAVGIWTPTLQDIKLESRKPKNVGNVTRKRSPWGMISVFFVCRPSGQVLIVFSSCWSFSKGFGPTCRLGQLWSFRFRLLNASPLTTIGTCSCVHGNEATQ
jgi:hypothetical protein